MKKEYLKKRIIEWCVSHDYSFMLFANGALLLESTNVDVFNFLVFPSLSYAYKKLIIDGDSSLYVLEYDSGARVQ